MVGKDYGFSEDRIVQTTIIDKDKNGFIRQTVKDADIQGDDVVFFDYDGTVLHSYKADAFLRMPEMPKNPTHNGLISRGWNWSYDDARAYVQKYGKLNVGQMYAPADGKTHIKIHIPEDGRPNFKLCFTQTVANGVIVDWGDGSDPDTDSTVNDAVHMEHTYTKLNADYEITLKTVNGCEIGYGFNDDDQNVHLSMFDNSTAHAIYVTELIISDSVTNIGQRVFANCYSLRSLVIPDSVTSIGQKAFRTCFALQSLTVPDSVTSIGQQAFANCYAVQTLVIPDCVISIEQNAFGNCSVLQSLIIPDSVTSIGQQAFLSCAVLQSLVIPDSVTSIGQQAFLSCLSLRSLTIPDSVTSIEQSAFSSCNSLQTLVIPDSVTSIEQNAFSSCLVLYTCIIQSTTPPTLGTNAFQYIPSDAKILVPAESVDTYKAASGWSTYAEQIFAMEEE